MKLKVLKCPECKANIEINNKRSSCFCSYCGSQIILDDEKQIITINKNINVTKNIFETKRYIDEAEVERVKAADKSDKRELFVLGMMLVFIVLILLGVGTYFVLIPKLAESQGKIAAGYYRDLVGKDYETVEAHFEAAGFTNIELIDLDDSGIAFWREGNVKSISVGGDTDFESHQRYSPDTKVVISYH